MNLLQLIQWALVDINFLAGKRPVNKYSACRKIPDRGFGSGCSFLYLWRARCANVCGAAKDISFTQSGQALTTIDASWDNISADRVVIRLADPSRPVSTDRSNLEQEDEKTCASVAPGRYQKCWTLSFLEQNKSDSCPLSWTSTKSMIDNIILSWSSDFASVSL